MRTLPEIEALFAYKHLPPHLATVSKPFHDMAIELSKTTAIATRTKALWKLWEAKNLVVWQAAAEHSP